LRKHFPKALIIPTGGTVYNLALTHLLHNLKAEAPADISLLRSLMLVDEIALARPGVDNHYAVALAWKSGRPIPHKRIAFCRNHTSARTPTKPIQLARRFLPADIRYVLNRI